MSLSIKLLESDKVIQRKINKALANEVNKTVSKNLPRVQDRISRLIRSSLNSSPEIISLRSGILKLEFGLDKDPTFDIIEAIMSSLKIKFSPINYKDFSGGVLIVLQPSDYRNLFSLPAAYQEIDDGVLPWLSWLLTLGDSVIITRFGVEIGDFPDSRTGGARMSQKAAPYKVNSAYSGTEEDNFITRSVARVSNEIQAIIKGVL